MNLIEQLKNTQDEELFLELEQYSRKMLTEQIHKKSCIQEMKSELDQLILETSNLEYEQNTIVYKINKSLEYQYLILIQIFLSGDSTLVEG